MTDLIERAAPERPALDRPALLGTPCETHAHTARCWWHIEVAAWVCPPSGGGRT